MTYQEQDENERASAVLICRKWLASAPIAGRRQVATAETAGPGELSPWIEKIDDMAAHCSESIRLGGYPASDRTLKVSDDWDLEFELPDIFDLLEMSHANSVITSDDNGDFYQRYIGSIFRQNKAQDSLLIIWRRGEHGSWG